MWLAMFERIGMYRYSKHVFHTRGISYGWRMLQYAVVYALPQMETHLFGYVIAFSLNYIASYSLSLNTVTVCINGQNALCCSLILCTSFHIAQIYIYKYMAK